MDLTLSLSYTEQNNNEAIILTDGSNYGTVGSTSLVSGDSLVKDLMYQIISDGGHSTFTGAGSSSASVGSRFIATSTPTLGAGDSCVEVMPYASEISDCKLTISVTTSDSSKTTYSTIDLISEFGPFTSTDDLEFTIDKSYLGGSNGDELDDGVYDIKYEVSYTGTDQSGTDEVDADDLNITALVYGVVKVKVYDKLRQLPISYQCKDCDTKREIKEADFAAAYLSAIEKSAYTGKTEELLLMLSTLESILKNGSYIMW